MFEHPSNTIFPPAKFNGNFWQWGYESGIDDFQFLGMEDASTLRGTEFNEGYRTGQKAAKAASDLGLA